MQRYPVEWADALEEMAGLGAEWLFPGHGLVVQGRDAVRTVLTETARYLRVIIDQVLERMNAGQTPEEIFHAVEPDPELAKRPYLQANYDHPKFIVRNLLRLWGGWWNGNAADLLPATHGGAGRARSPRLAGGVDSAGRRAAARSSPPATHAGRARAPSGRRAPRPPNRAAQAAQARRLRAPPRRGALADGAGHLSRRDERRDERRSGKSRSGCSGW